MTSIKKNQLRSIWLFLALVLIAGVWFGLKFFQNDQQGLMDSEAYATIEVSKESCTECHVEMTGFSSFHDPKLLGCVVCHLGNPASSDKDLSHQDMVVIPGNLSDAEFTCGTCHKQELEKIQHSLMTTNSGLVAVDKYIFGESDSPDHHFDIRDLGHSPADDHLRDLCANCHLGAEKTELGAISQLSRGGGCNACHLNYSEEASNQLDDYLVSGKTKLAQMHPSTDVFMSDTHCFGCHSRSSRISTNYMGWHETLLDELPASENYKQFEDERIYEFKGADVHHSKGLLCIDCHSSHEVMGDGKDYLHEEDAVKLSCSDCHYKEEPLTVAYDDLDIESSLVFMHRNYQHQEKEMLKVAEDGHPLVNTFINDRGEAYLIGKKDGKEHLIKKQSDICARDEAHQSLSCSSCHSQWAPRCIGCHNTYDNDKQGYDLLEKKLIEGTWIEHVFEFETGLPAMGVRITEEGRIVEPAIPGMILSIDKSAHEASSSNEPVFERLYAANAPHTTAKEARSCESCHLDPASLGYGKGKLRYEVNGKSATWNFEPIYSVNPIDGLPEDAWIPFLTEPSSKKLSTRSDFRPLSVAEQQKVLTVGACLQCHSKDSKIMTESLKTGLNPLLLKLSDKCLLPDY
ncbi:hypothetical protein QWY87_17485 [Lutimonas halocynthiae]|uniref:hypothetical protein n=1 Tax=Lutimonas halocynthiae TaxID=1446477 RepID=UPI0025B33156|nr:hypothetical protein [Lutimonas halocynthiae]MDN3644511.1 hypothetical protein [Lutimonas halocynthiae]